MTEPLLQIHNLNKTYSLGNREIKALHNLSLSINKTETLGLVGESGCGKTTLGRALLRLETVDSGEVYYDKKPLLQMSAKDLFLFRREAQIIFQDPYSSLNPRMTVEEIVAEPLKIHSVLPKTEIPHHVAKLLSKVGLSASSLKRFPHEFSGGQRQRIGIARALALKPRFIVCDEPISALDVPIQAQIINLLKELQQEFGLTYLFITHNLAMVKYLSDRIAVMYLGHLVELSSAEELYNTPLHPYTQTLLAAIPQIDPAKRRPTPIQKDLCFSPPQSKGCPFAPRCQHASSRCLNEKPQLTTHAGSHQVACHLYCG